ncbi:hypothetical protein RN001_003651 [Aquatica leii]|uniref:Uncharacterized protein n=1 Tax=Aquatica leii TaxID=1421715 RepID=A0AAN7PFE1_9COLE|nr:hypothetical protein RN001_003651 [Aquatica leii]
MMFLNEHVGSRPSTSSFSKENSPSPSISDITTYDEDVLETEHSEKIITTDLIPAADHNYISLQNNSSRP